MGDRKSISIIGITVFSALLIGLGFGLGAYAAPSIDTIEVNGTSYLDNIATSDTSPSVFANFTINDPGVTTSTYDIKITGGDNVCTDCDGSSTGNLVSTPFDFINDFVFLASGLIDNNYQLILKLLYDPLNNGTFTNVLTQIVDFTIDTINPTALTDIDITSTNADTAWAKLGDTVIVNFTAPEADIIVTSATLAGESVTSSAINPSGNDWGISLELSGDEPEGVTEFEIAFVDTASNTGPKATLQILVR